MNVYYSVPLNVLTDDAGNPLQGIQELAYGDISAVVFSALDENNNPVDLSSAVRWELAIDADRAAETRPVCSIPTEGIVYNATARTLSYTVNTRNLSFFAEINGKSQVSLLNELSGYDDYNIRVFRFTWNLIGVMPVLGHEPPEDPSSPTPVVATNDFTAFRVYADDTDDHTQFYPKNNSYSHFLPSYIRFADADKSDLSQVPRRLYDLYQSTPDPTEAEIIDALSYCAGDIYKSQTERFVIWANKDYANSDIVVDWGDGTQSLLANGQTQTDRGAGFYDLDEYDLNGDDPVIEFMFSHKYAAEGSYYVKITGTGYSAIRHYYNGLKNADGSQKYPEAINLAAPKYNLMYETMGPDTPIASCVSNLSSFSIWNKRLLHIYVPYTNIKMFRHVVNWSNTFGYCTNNQSARGFYFNGYGLTGNQTVGSFLSTNVSLEIFTGSLPAATSAANWSGCFLDNTKMRADISKIIPACGVLPSKFNVSNAFRNNLSLVGTVPADLLWGDTTTRWSGTESAFNVTNQAYQMPIRAQVPVSWGGTNSEILIPVSATSTDIATLQAKITELENRIAALE